VHHVHKHLVGNAGYVDDARQRLLEAAAEQRLKVSVVETLNDPVGLVDERKETRGTKKRHQGNCKF
jgi:hypothetical protein